MAEGDRQSRADQPALVSDPAERARLEARNALQQFDVVMEMVDHWTLSGRPFRLRPSAILDLHRAALNGLEAFAGAFRPADVEIQGSKHRPVGAHLVPSAVEEFCDEVNERWAEPPITLAALVLWKMNWIHPFTDGNGRTARAVSYLVLCARLGYRLPGTITIPELIAKNKAPYYGVLEAADAGDLKPLESLLGSLLAKQLVEVHKAALTSGSGASDRTLH